MSDEPREWSLSDCRRRVGELESAYREVNADLQRTATELASALYGRSLAERRTADLQRELEASQRREALLVSELGDRKRAETSGHTTRSATVTPIRPPAKPRKP